MTTAAALAVLLLAAPGRASEFLDSLHRAGARDAKDPERVEFATRAIRAWRPADGAELLADAHFRRAEGEFARWEDAAAEADLSKSLELDPRGLPALLLRGRARLRLGRAAEASRDFQEYAAGKPEDGEGWLGLGEARGRSAAARRGTAASVKPALDALARAAKLLDESDARPALARGEAWLGARRPDKALEALDEAARKSQERRPDALAWRARAKMELRDARGARTDAGAAAEGLERRLDSLRRANAPEPALAAARADAADARVRRAGAEEALSLTAEAAADYRLACALGRDDACARAEALAPKPAAPAPKAPKRRRRPNPPSGSGERIYAN